MEAAPRKVMTEQSQDAIRKELTALFARARLSVSDAELERMVDLVAENKAAGNRVRRLLTRYDEPAFGLPSRRRP
jgi:hypothetical protein